MSEEEIIKKLKKAKWSSEQITYAMKKYSGRNTGMFELPFLRIIFKGGDKDTNKISQPKPHFGENPGNFSGSPLTNNKNVGF